MNMQFGTLNIFFNNSNTATAFLGSILSKSSTYINTFLKKLNVKMIVEVISLIEWNFDESKRKKSYKELLVNTKTKLSELYFILEKGNYLAISFEKL